MLPAGAVEAGAVVVPGGPAGAVAFVCEVAAWADTSFAAFEVVAFAGEEVVASAGEGASACVSVGGSHVQFHDQSHTQFAAVLSPVCVEVDTALLSHPTVNSHIQFHVLSAFVSSF